MIMNQALPVRQDTVIDDFDLISFDKHMSIPAIGTGWMIRPQENIRNSTVVQVGERDVFDIFVFQIEESENIIFFLVQ